MKDDLETLNSLIKKASNHARGLHSIVSHAVHIPGDEGLKIAVVEATIELADGGKFTALGDADDLGDNKKQTPTLLILADRRAKVIALASSLGMLESIMDSAQPISLAQRQQEASSASKAQPEPEPEPEDEPEETSAEKPRPSEVKRYMWLREQVMGSDEDGPEESSIASLPRDHLQKLTAELEREMKELNKAAEDEGDEDAELPTEMVRNYQRLQEILGLSVSTDGEVESEFDSNPEALRKAIAELAKKANQQNKSRSRSK